MVVFIKQKIYEYIKVVENIYDTIIVVKISNCTLDGKPIYLIFCYIPPDGSVFYRRNDVNLFQCLYDLITKYTTKGHIFVSGDMNSRCGFQDDFITNDILHHNIIDNMQPLASYTSDNFNVHRESQDHFVNQQGRQLLTFCKSTGFRIVNGRHPGDPSGSVTFYSNNGVSLIDFLLCKQDDFKYIGEFASGNFNTLSDHSPLSFKLICEKSQSSISVPTEKSSVHCRVECKNIRWNEEEIDSINNDCYTNMNLFHSIVDRELKDQDQIDTCVNDLCDALNEIILPKCHTTNVHSFNNTVDSNNMKDKAEDKPWFNAQCKKMYADYKVALHVFNRTKSVESRNSLLHKKSLYKKFEKTLKVKYKRQEGNMIESLKKSNPKQFYKYFSKRKSNSNTNNIPFDDFYMHFKNLSENSALHEDDSFESDLLDVEQPIFEELDYDISIDEIRECIRYLKRNKSCNEDYMLNEIFIDCGETIMPILYKLFNAIFRSGFFPQSWSKATIVPVFKKGNVNDTNNYRAFLWLVVWVNYSHQF